MKILWLAQHPIPSLKMHPAPWVTSLAQSITQRGIKLEIVTSNTKIRNKVEEYEFDNYKLYALKALSGYLDLPLGFSHRIQSIKKFLEPIIHNYDVVHVHGTEYQLATSLLRLKTNIPFIISIQGIITECKKYIDNTLSFKKIAWELASRYESKEIRNSSHFSCRTHWDTNFVKSLNPNATIFNIWEILRTAFYNQNLESYGENILFTGGMNELKGLSAALKTFNTYLKSHTGVLHITGYCTQEFVNKVIKKYKLENIKDSNIRLHGFLTAEEMVALYADCFCLYHPTLIDNSPNSVCEAQLAGLPVVASNVGGVSSLITDYETGMLFENEQRNDLAALLRLKEDIGLRKKISNNARIIAKDRHSIESITDETIRMYTMLTKKTCNVKTEHTNTRMTAI